MLRGLGGSEPEKELGTTRHRGGCRKLNIEQLHNMHSSSKIVKSNYIKTLRREGYVRRIVEMRTACNILVRKPKHFGKGRVFP
jgi:hypothetical protein